MFIFKVIVEKGDNAKMGDDLELPPMFYWSHTEEWLVQFHLAWAYGEALIQPLMGEEDMTEAEIPVRRQDALVSKAIKEHRLREEWGCDFNIKWTSKPLSSLDEIETILKFGILSNK